MRDFHIMPIEAGREREHYQSVQCQCHPVNYDGLIVHKLADGQESIEERERAELLASLRAEANS